ncbi:MAG: hypothetical protein AAF652_12060 [Cyanobacteria bacterium P01_C01_bin.72]
MSEANQNSNLFDSESNRSLEQDGWKQQSQERSAVGASITNEPDLLPRDVTAQAAQEITSGEEIESESLTAKMNWQKVAHKLREYNRKLLKKVFRLEQELAEIDNKFNKYIEKSKSTDLLLVQQAEELKNYQEKVALLVEQLACSQQQIDSQELIIKQVSEQHQLSQQQTAQLERECTLLQEKYNRKSFELVAKEKESQELQSELNQQQHSALQQEAKLKRYQEAASRKEKTNSRNQNYPHNRFIQPWSTSTIPEPKIALPKTKIPKPAQPTIAKKTTPSTTETIKTAAEIATWSASNAKSKNKNEQSGIDQNKIAKSSQGKKPTSLAAVDLPTFPRPQ